MLLELDGQKKIRCIGAAALKGYTPAKVVEDDTFKVVKMMQILLAYTIWKSDYLLIQH